MNTKKSDFTGIFGSILRIPEISTKIRGTTGIQKSLLEPDENSHTIDDVINEMRGLPRTQYIKDYWDCEDRALFAISRARCKFPCMPIGLAIGYCTSAIQGLHALVVVWSKDLTKGEFYDPELRETLGFNPEVIIPFPCDGTKRPEGIPYASNLPFLPRGGAFVLDSTYDFSKEKIATAREFLENKGPEECEESNSACSKKTFRKCYRFSDRVLSWYIRSKAEKEMLGAPIGVAFGKWKNQYMGVLLLWNDPSLRPEYWRIDNIRMRSDDARYFRPEIIIA